MAAGVNISCVIWIKVTKKSRERTNLYHTYNVCFCSMNIKHIQSKDLKASEADRHESFRAVGGGGNDGNAM